MSYLKKAESSGVGPIGLGARDTLRFEVCLPLYGHELSNSISPIEAGLYNFVKLQKPIDFIGKESLETQKRSQERVKIGLKIIGRGIAREGYAVNFNGNQIGFVTSGSYCPTLDQNHALALIDQKYSQEEKFDVVIRNKMVEAIKVKTPFYNKKYKKTGGI